MKRYISLLAATIALLIAITCLYVSSTHIILFDETLVKAQRPTKIEHLFTSAELNTLKEYNFQPSTLQQLLNSGDFDIKNIDIYHSLLNSETPSSIQYALESGKYPDTQTNFYQNIKTVSNPDDILVLVNKNFSLPVGYKPDDLVLLDLPFYNYKPNNEGNYLREEAASAAKAMFEAAKDEQSYTLLSRSGFRSVEGQILIYQDYFTTGGSQLADSYSARPNHSEHQTGLALDVSAITVKEGIYPTFGSSPEAKWVANNAHRFGFIVRYLEGRQGETGYAYEPWHLRYVGIPAATEIYEKGLILEDYLLEHALIQTIN